MDFVLFLQNTCLVVSCVNIDPPLRGTFLRFNPQSQSAVQKVNLVELHIVSILCRASQGSLKLDTALRPKLCLVAHATLAIKDATTITRWPVFIFNSVLDRLGD
jgi:hypothetical protein